MYGYSHAFSLRYALLLAATFFLSSISPSQCIPSRRQLASCNGSPSTCTTKYSLVTGTIGAHDSAFVGPLIAQNQNIPPSAQLARGARMMQVQTHRAIDDPNRIELCHTNCFLEDAGPLTDWLGDIKSFLDAPGNENEFITILLTNPDGIPLAVFDENFKSVGLDQLCFIPAPGQAVPLQLDSWPTVGEMIAAGKRVVVFFDAGADPTSLPYVLDEFSYFFETPFDTLDFSSCALDRPFTPSPASPTTNSVSPQGRMYIVNHFRDVQIAPDVLVPDRLHAADSNSLASVDAHQTNCQGLYGGAAPNFLLLDFVDQGDWTQVAAQGVGVGQRLGDAACGALGAFGLC